MSLQIFGYHADPSSFAVTKAEVGLKDCAFLLDFARPLEKVRWFGVNNKWIGITVALYVPIVHHGEKSGGFRFLIMAREPYFADIKGLWRKHRGSRPTMVTQSVDPGKIIADFAAHFPDLI